MSISVQTVFLNYKKMEKKFNIFFLSNMMAEKGVWVLIDACKLLEQRNCSFECHCVGKWSDITEDSFNQYVLTKGLKGKVFAHGAKYGDDKNVFWKKADIFVFPTFYHNECFPLVLLEAMQQGVACIASDEGGISDIIENDVTGFVVEKRNAKALADKIAYLMEHPDICRRMGEAGKEKFEREFTLSRFENNMVDVLNRCL